MSKRNRLKLLATEQRFAPAPEENTINFKSYSSQQILLIPKSINQERYINYLSDPNKLIVFATGPAGTGKTMLAVLAALKALKSRAVRKIIITRPAVGVDDEKHGFLPGDLNSKMEPWVKPIFDVMLEYYHHKDITKMLEEEIIEISPLAFMRGRNLKDAYIICDEMQNASTNQIKMVLTRLSENSKMVITGDLQQTDKKFHNDNGLKDFTDRLKAGHSNSIVQVDFAIKDIQRHPVVAEVLNLYGEG